MKPGTALARTRGEMEKNPNLRIIGISGPGEPLANPETFETIEKVREEFRNASICVSTNGTLLENYVAWLSEKHVETITVSMSTSDCSTASKIYEWAILGNELIKGIRMGSRIVESQLRGIAKATRAGINVKVNSILIPGFNEQDIVPLAQELADLGVTLHNIVPLVPSDKLHSIRPPTYSELAHVRRQASLYIDQFSHCKQCRSDVVGMPGCDTIL